MTNPTPHGQVPKALIDLIDAYAETRHRCGGIYNAKTEAARNAVIEALSEVQALSAAPAGWKLVPVEPTRSMMASAVIFANGNAVYKNVSATALEIEESIYGEAYSAMLAASPTPPAEQQAAPKAAPGEQNTVPAEWLEQAYREGWAACRDAETIGEEAEDWAFGNSTANSRMIDAQQAAPQPAPHLPERDASLPAERQGLFRKFVVGRVDGSDKPGGKHHGCTYFVLDVDHDPCARPALAAYAAACESTHPTLAADLRAKWGVVPAPKQEAQAPCPTCAALARTVMLDQVSFDRKPDCYGIRQITDDEGVEEWEDIRTSPDVAREEANDMMATGRGEIYEVVPLWTTPQPAPAPLSESIDQVERALAIIGVVGAIDGHDVVRRESVLEIARRAAIAAQGGK